MTFYYSHTLKKFLDKWPGKRTFGIYRFLPIFFGLGAALEFSMINWNPGQTNFYSVYKQKQAKKIAELQIEFEQLEASSRSGTDNH